ncbi:MAG: hypothetical protein ACRDVZ_00090, partial [Jiangellaceae bacterium]
MKRSLVPAGLIAALLFGVGCSAERPPAAEPITDAVSSSPSLAPTAPPEPRTFTLVATGDVLLHERLWSEARRDAKPDGTWD